jgi:4-amino-4-deoxy-L-arabinose transferase-like glycosyltransferase
LTRTQLRRHATALGLILVCAVLVRVAWLAYVHPNPTDGRFDDTVWYRGAAHYFANGDGYVNPFTATPTAAWPPGYPVVLGVVFKMFGEGIWSTYALNVALGVLTVGVVYAIGVAMFDRRTAIIAALVMAFWPGQVYFSSLTLSEPLFTFLFATAVLLIVVAARQTAARGPLVITFGLVTGLAMLTRGQAGLLLPFALLAWRAMGWRWRPALGWAMLAALVAGVVLAPWVARNQRELGSPVIIATNMGPNVWIGNHAGASGRMRIAEPEPPLPDRGNLTQPEFEVKADRLALRKGLAYLFTHPTAEWRLSGAKIRAMYESDATALDWNAGFKPGFYASDSVDAWLRGAANAFWFAALALSLLGLLGSRIRPGEVVVLLPALVLIWTAGHLLFFGDARFHYPIVFALSLLAARGIVVLFEAVRRPQASLSRRYARA